MDLMINPSVGLTVVTSSFMIRLTIVVLPALSKPLASVSRSVAIWEERAHSISILISLSFSLAFRKIESIFPVSVCQSSAPKFLQKFSRLRFQDIENIA